MGQVIDWMNELYPRWVAAHGVMIVTPVYWYQAPSVLKLMIDRLVCADGGNPDPTTTHGKKAEEAKELELEGWHYPRHLAGRVFAVVVHGDAVGAETLRRSLSDWLTRHEAAAGHARRAGSIATSATTSRTRRATTRSMRTPPCSRRSATRRRRVVEAVALSRARTIAADSGRDRRRPK